MDNEKNGQLRQEYEDAVVAVFMEQYAAALDAGLKEVLTESQQEEFPPALEKRCTERIRKERAKQKRKAFSKAFLRACRRAAVVFLVLLGLFSFLFMTVEAFRIPIMNFFLERTDRFTLLSGKKLSENTPGEFDPEDPLGNIIPEEYALVSLEGSIEGGMLIALYSNDKGASFYFSMMPSHGTMQVDTEDACVSWTDVQGHDAMVTVENEMVQINWLHASLETIFSLVTINVSEDMALFYAEEVAAMFD